MTKILTWNFHADDSDKGRYDMILGRYLLTTLGIILKLFYHVIETDVGPFKWSTVPIYDMGVYTFNDSNTEKITPEELFMNSYAEEIEESEEVHTPTKRYR